MKKEYILGIDLGVNNAFVSSTYKGCGDSFRYMIKEKDPDWTYIEHWVKRCAGYVIGWFKGSKATIIALENLSFDTMTYEKFMELVQEEILVKAGNIKTHLVDCQYTSRICWVCGYEDVRNRPSQDSFHCYKCGFSENADVNAAKVIAIKCAIDLAKKFKEQGQNWMNRFFILESNRNNKILVEKIEWACDAI